jgi:hypothetical protein
MTEEKPPAQQENPSQPMSAASPSARKETLDERADRVQQMMIENLKNPENHSAYHECDVTPTTLDPSLSGKNPKLVEAANRIGQMMLENLRDPECHPTPIRRPDGDGEPSTKADFDEKSTP